MAIRRTKKVKYGMRITMWFLAVIAAGIMLSLVLHQFGVIDLRRFIPGNIDKTIAPINWQDMELLDQDRLDRMMEANDIRSEELGVRSKGLDDTAIKLEERRKKLEKERNAVEEEKKRLQEDHKQYDKKEETITQTAKELTMMDENVAVAILEKRDNHDIIWIMRVTDELALESGLFSLVSTWLSLMDPIRAAEIQRERDLIPDPEI